MRFCGQCGAALEPLAFRAGERKLATILFADTVGSTQMLGRLDPEQVRDRITQFFRIAQEEINRYGGTVDKFIGDAVMAVFGLPSVHEEDPERASRAALAIKTRTRSAVEAGTLAEIRIGLNTGEVVADTPTRAGGEILVVGEVVNLAFRLQQHAAPGQVLIGERTMRAIRHVATLRPVGLVQARGATAPLPAWELMDIAEPRGRPLAATPFVGREEDLNLLRGVVRRVLHERRGHVITILGTAGVGKTRLVQQLRPENEGLHILRGRALPYGPGIPFWALGEAIRAECGILIGDPLETARRRLEETTASLQIGGATAVLSVILGLAREEHEMSRETLFAGVRAFFQALAQRAPLLLIVEDLHAAEDVTLDLLEHAADWIRDVPMVLFLLSRPELLERRPAWMGGKRTAMAIFLDPLAPEDSREMIRAILGHKHAPDSLVNVILGRAEGNPLFVEEMLTTFLEKNVLSDLGSRWELRVPLAQVTIPDTVNAVIAARIDALPAREKQLLQIAAIVGKDFWLGAVQSIAGGNHLDDVVRSLMAKEVLMRSPRSAVRDEEEFAFRHILIRDVAYSMIPKTERWLKHARCAEWVEGIARDRQAEYADVIAFHWQQVLTLRRDLGLPAEPQAQERTIASYLLAGDRAAAVYANVTAVDHYTKALALHPQPPARKQALLGRSEVLLLLGEYEKAREDLTALRALARGERQPKWEALALDRIGQSYRRQDEIERALEYLGPALALSRHGDDAVVTGRILNHMGSVYYSLVRTEESAQSFQEARRVLERCGDLAGLAESLHGLGEIAMSQGRYRECVEWSTESAKCCEQVGNRSLAGENRYMIAISQLLLGEYEAAQTEAERSVAELADIGDVWNSSFALGAAARIAVTTGEFGKALDYATRGWELAQKIGADRQAILNLLMKGAAHREMEDFQSALEVDRRAAELARRGSVGAFVMPLILFSLTLDGAALGERDESRGHLEEAGRLLAEIPKRADYLHQLMHAKGRVHLAWGDPEAARDTAIALAEGVDASGILHSRVPALLLRADSEAALGNSTDAALGYRAAAEQAEGLGCPPALWRALAGLAEVHAANDRAREAAEAARQARIIIARLAETVSNEQLRSTFLASPRVQRILTLARD